MATTPIKARRYPQESDTPDVAQDIKNLALDLESAAKTTVGTLAARPSSGMTAGDRHLVNGDGTTANNGVEWEYTGSSWIAVNVYHPESTVNKGVASGYCDLDGSSHVPLSRISGLGYSNLLAGVGRLHVVAKAANYTAAFWEMVTTTAAGFTVTSPAPSADGVFGVRAGTTVTGASPITVTVASGLIYGEGLNGVASLTLGTPGAFVILQTDGTNWFVEAGALDTGWVACTLAANWTNAFTGVTPAARIVRGFLYLKGTAQNGTGGSVVNPQPITLPAGFSTSVTRIATVPIDNGAGLAVPARIQSTVQVMGTVPSNNAVGFDGVSVEL